MAANSRAPTSYTTASTTNPVSTSYRTGNYISTSNQHISTSNPFYTTGEYATTTSRPRTEARSIGRPSTARPRTGVSTLGVENQDIVCAVSESRGISPTVGLAFVNLDTGEAVLSQISDSQTYVRTLHKLMVFNPTTILIVSTAASPKSKLFSIIEDALEDIQSNLTLLDRHYWAETTGIEYIEHLAFAEDVDTLKTAVSGNYFAVCAFAAALKYVELGMAITFPFRSLRIKYEPSEGSMMIDLSTIHSLELVQNLHNAKSKDCLLGLLNETQTPMGGRLLRANILQPLTNPDTLNTRYDAVEELSTKEEMFHAVRQALKPFLDADKILTQLILIPVQPSLELTAQAINNVIMLKQFVSLIKPVFEALTGSRSSILNDIRTLCTPENIETIQQLIDDVLNKDITYVNQPLDLRNQRTYAVKAGVNGLLDVARQTYRESITDAYEHVNALKEEHNLPLATKFETARQFYIQLSATDLEDRALPTTFINVVRKKNKIDCQTLDLLKSNQKIANAHNEVVMLSDKMVQGLIASIREHMSILFKICEGVAMLDMLSSFAQVVTTAHGYVRPVISGTLAIRAGRHPIREKIHNTKFIPNDVYATQQERFQIVTGCNMSGKSTYIRAVALLTVMAQVGCFVSAQTFMFPIMHQLFARISMDDNIEANVSTFAVEMRETAFILKNIDRRSIVIIDELGRGTSTRDGLAIAIAIAEALVGSRALVWFATHFRDLAKIMSERNGVVNLHLAVDMHDDRMEMLYRLESGATKDEHYGLKLARVLPLPPDVIEHAEHVAATLKQQTKEKNKRSLAIITARRRKVLLNLKEHLVQAKNTSLNDETLREWLKDLQNEFIRRMTALDEEARKIELGIDDDDEYDHENEERAVTQVDEQHSTPAEEQHHQRDENSNTQREIPESLAALSYRDQNGVEYIDLTQIESRATSTAGISDEL